MEITESIYEGVLELPYYKPTRADTNRAGHIRQKRGEAVSSWTCAKKGESAVKGRKKQLGIPTGKSKTCLIHGLGHS